MKQTSAALSRLKEVGARGGRVALAGALALAFAPTVSAFAADDEYKYCYAGLSWAEYWAGENVYEAGNDASSETTDVKGQYDCGAFDTVSRATTNHGLHRGSYQCNTTIFAKSASGDEDSFAIATWSADGKSFITTDGEEVAYSKGVCTIDGVSYTLTSYEIYGTKYVPVKVKASDYAAFVEDRESEGYDVVESGGTLAGGYGEVQLKAYSVTADINASTYGLKTATKQSDGSFTFSASNCSSAQTGSGISGQSLKKVTETTEAKYAADLAAGSATGIYAVVANNSGTAYSTPSVKDGTVKTGNAITPGGFGEFLRVDLCGDYGDLGGMMQSATWTYYGKDSAGKNVVRSFGTKFAADNWMHKSMDIQLGLTDSIRCQFPEGYDGTGYWTITVHALGYEDYTTPIFEVTSDNFAQDIPATAATKAELQSLVNKASGLNKDNYTAKSWEDLAIEVAEATEILAGTAATQAEVTEQIGHLTNALDSLVSTVQDLKVTVKKTVTVKAKKVAKKAQTVKAISKVAGAKGKVSYKAKFTHSAAKKYVKVNAKTGKLTIKKGAKKGTYTVKIAVNAKASGIYKAASKTITVKVKVK